MLCGGMVLTSLPGTHPYGPTIEHRYPVRRIIADSRTWDEAVALACDTTWWALACRRCQDRQGGASTVERMPKQMYAASRQW